MDQGRMLYYALLGFIFENGLQWSQAEMLKCWSCSVKVISYNSVLYACEICGQWSQALLLLAKLQGSTLNRCPDARAELGEG